MNISVPKHYHNKLTLLQPVEYDTMTKLFLVNAKLVSFASLTTGPVVGSGMSSSAKKSSASDVCKANKHQIKLIIKNITKRMFDVFCLPFRLVAHSGS